MGIFRTILEEEKKRTAVHFLPGCDAYPVDRSKLEPPFFVDEEAEKAKEEAEEEKESNFRIKTTKKKDNGFAGTRKCYLERRRGMGIDGNETHYVVYAEDGLDMLVAATSTSTSGVYNFFEDEEVSEGAKRYGRNEYDCELLAGQGAPRKGRLVWSRGRRHMQSSSPLPLFSSPSLSPTIARNCNIFAALLLPSLQHFLRHGDSYVGTMKRCDRED